MTGLLVLTEVVELTDSHDPSSSSRSDSDTQADLVPVPQDLPTIEALIPAVELVRARGPTIDHVLDEVPVLLRNLTVTFGRNRRKGGKRGRK